MASRIRLHLVDAGQDFLTFDIEGGTIVDTQPFQGWLWNGRAVAPDSGGDHWEPGDFVFFPHTGDRLKYPVERVETVASNQGAGG